MKNFLYTLTIVSAILVAVVGCGSSSNMITDDGINRSELMLLHNKERMTRGLPQLLESTELQNRAQQWAESMARKNSLRHGSLSGTSFNYVGENIAKGQDNVDVVTEDWMNSTGHRRNILNPNYTHAGFGYARLEDGRPYWCAQFGGN